MDITLTRPMIDALKSAPDLPENLRKLVNAAHGHGDHFHMTLDDDEAMAMTEMCQWYIRKDPTTGQLGEQAKVFEGVVNAIYQAEGG